MYIFPMIAHYASVHSLLSLIIPHFYSGQLLISKLPQTTLSRFIVGYKNVVAAETGCEAGSNQRNVMGLRVRFGGELTVESRQ